MIKSWRLITCIVLFLIAAEAKDIIVSRQGNITTLSSALELVADGDVIRVSRDVYTEKLNFPRGLAVQNVTITALDSVMPIISSISISCLATNVRNISFENIRFLANSSRVVSQFAFIAKDPMFRDSGVSGINLLNCWFSSSLMRPSWTASIDPAVIRSFVRIDTLKCDMRIPLFQSDSLTHLQEFSMIGSQLTVECSLSVKTDGSPDSQIRVMSNNIGIGSISNPKTISFGWSASFVFLTANRIIRSSRIARIDMSINAANTAELLDNTLDIDLLMLSPTNLDATYYINNNTFEGPCKLINRTQWDRLDIRFNSWSLSDSSPPAAASTFTSVKELYPWTGHVGNKASYSLACPADCPIAHCNFVDGSCLTSSNQPVLLSLIGYLVPISVVLSLFGFCCFRRKLLLYNRRVYFWLSGRPVPENHASNERARLIPDPQVWIESGRPNEKLGSPSQCARCSVNPNEYVMVPCGHNALCGACADVYDRSANAKCPVCGQATRHIQRIFK